MGFSLPQFPDGHLLTHSSETKFKTCMRKYYLSQVLGLRTAHSSEALRIGSMWHLGVGEYEGGLPIEAAVAKVRTAYLETDCPPYLQPDEYKTEEETAVAMIRGHHWRWKDDQILTTVQIEMPFEIPIVNPETGRETPTFKSGGKIDRIARLPDGRLALVERKTTSDQIDAGSDYWTRLLMDSQISRYFLAAREKGYPVETTVYDVIRKPGIKPKAIAKADRAYATSQGVYFGWPLHGICPERETPEMYGCRLLADMKDRPDFYFARREIPRLDADLQEFRAEQWTIQKQVRDCELNTLRFGAAAWPRNTAACTSSYRCEYLEICRGTCGDPNEEIPAGFRRVGVLHEELQPVATEGTL